MGDRQRLLNLEDVRGVLGDMFEEITVSGYEWLDVWDQFGTPRGFCQEELHKRLIGQDDAVRVLAQASLECVEPSEAADFEILLWTVRRQANFWSTHHWGFNDLDMDLQIQIDLSLHACS